ncbi:M15 family peptidase, partial [Yersinia sp. 1252 StPb PI]
MTSNFRFSQRSEGNLKGVNDDLVRVVRRALELSTVDFGVIEGVRTVERQKELVATGKSQTMNSRHISGNAVDLLPTGANW